MWITVGLVHLNTDQIESASWEGDGFLKVRLVSGKRWKFKELPAQALVHFLEREALHTRTILKQPLPGEEKGVE